MQTFQESRRTASKCEMGDGTFPRPASGRENEPRERPFDRGFLKGSDERDGKLDKAGIVTLGFLRPYGGRELRQPFEQSVVRERS